MTIQPFPTHHPAACLRLMGTLTHLQARDLAAMIAHRNGQSFPSDLAMAQMGHEEVYLHLCQGVDHWWFKPYTTSSSATSANTSLSNEMWHALALARCTFSWRWKTYRNPAHTYRQWRLDTYPHGLNPHVMDLIDDQPAITHATAQDPTALATFQRHAALATNTTSTLFVADSAHDMLAQKHDRQRHASA